MKEENVALFPIPGCVSFPGTSMSLHVFEPRYRAMVNHCIEHDMDMAVCHTQKTVHKAKSGQALPERLKSNQSTYKPFNVFSAGRCEIVEVLEDGRILLQVHFSRRLKLLDYVQTLPFNIVSCVPYNDLSSIGEVLADSLVLLRAKISKRLAVITHGVLDVESIFRSEEWQDKTAKEFSFEVFSLLDFDSELKQGVLEMQSLFERLTFVLKIINGDI